MIRLRADSAIFFLASVGPNKLVIVRIGYCVQVTTQFLKVEGLLDDDVGKTVKIEVERGGKTVTVTVLVSGPFFE